MIKIILFIVIMAIVAYYLIKYLILDELLTKRDKEFVAQIYEEAAALTNQEDNDLLTFLISISVDSKIGIQAMCQDVIFIVSEELKSTEAIELAQKIADYDVRQEVSK